MPGKQGYPRSERLTRKSEFERVYREGEKGVNHVFVCYVLRQAGQGRKIGYAVSRKVGSAVVRNRIKRYIREFYRTSRERLAEDLAVVVVARVAAAKMTHAQCDDAIDRIFRQGGVFSG